jgi:arylsulfatase A-like enzyme
MPNLDAMAVLGVNFTNAVSGMPLCCPFRGSMLTGRYPHHMVPGHEYPLPEGQPTLTQPFKAAGYHTGYFGKWHLGGFHESNGRAAMFITDPARRGGFDQWIGYENNNSPWDSWVHGGQGKDAVHYKLPGFETDCLTDLLIKYIKERAADKQPFFAIQSVQPPHDPFVAPAEYMRRYNGQQLQLRANVPPVRRIIDIVRRDLVGYYAMIENLDFNIGRVRQALEETGLAANTHIMYFADHGEMAGSHGQFRKMTPHEESIRIPFILSGEQARYNGRGSGQVNAPLNHVDIAPTTLGLCGIQKPAWMEGTDYSHYRLLKNPRSNEPDSAFIQSVVPSGHPNSVNLPWRGVVTRDGWKYVCTPGQSWMMFNLSEDPYEEVNLALNNQFRAERKKLITRLKQWINDTKDEFNVPAD